MSTRPDAPPLAPVGTPVFRRGSLIEPPKFPAIPHVPQRLVGVWEARELWKECWAYMNITHALGNSRTLMLRCASCGARLALVAEVAGCRLLTPHNPKGRYEHFEILRILDPGRVSGTVARSVSEAVHHLDCPRGHGPREVGPAKARLASSPGRMTRRSIKI